MITLPRAAIACLLFAGLAAASHAQQPRPATIEPGVYIEFGPSFVDYQNIDGADRCRELCERNARCRTWRYVAGTAPAEYGRARRLCLLSDRLPQSRTRPGGWVTSGQVR